MIAEHADNQIAKAMDCTDDAATDTVRFGEGPQISEDGAPSCIVIQGWISDGVS